MNDGNGKMVLFHGFSSDEIRNLMNNIKSSLADPGSVAFCMSTENNLDWPLKDIVSDVCEEHAYMNSNREKQTKENKAE